jgi:multidrug transporter EmrE-like cation transporter
MLNTRTLGFGLLFGSFDAIVLSTVKSVSSGLLSFKWMAFAALLHSLAPFLFLQGLKGETLTILNLVWDLSSGIIITAIGLLYFAESLRYTKILGLLFSFVALFFMAFESQPFENVLAGGVRKIKHIFTKQ